MLALVLVGLGGCRQLLGFDDPTVAPDAEPATDDGYLSGTRLKIKWNDYGGTRQFTSVYDAELDEVCQPTAWADDKTYCMPRTGIVGYTDAACSQPIGAHSKFGTCTLPVHYFSTSEARACNDTRRTRLFHGDASIPSVPFYTKNASGGCDGPIPGTNYEQFVLSPELPTTDLVDLTPTAVTMGRLEQRGFRGSDGSRLPAAIFDTVRDTTCTLSSTGSCAPTGVFPSGFADASCTEAIGRRLTGCPVPKYGARALDSGCPSPKLEYFTLGSELAQSTLYQGTTSMCTAYTRSPAYSYFAKGPVVDAAMLVRAVDAQPGRQIQRVYFTDGTAKLRSSLLFDTLHGVDCATIGGRCLPSDASLQTYFTTSECLAAVDVAVVYSGPLGCPLPATPHYALKNTASGDPCAPTYDVYNVGAQHVGALFSQNGGTGCTPAAFPNSTVYDVGDRVPPGEFATATALTDP